MTEEQQPAWFEDLPHKVAGLINIAEGFAEDPHRASAAFTRAWNRLDRHEQLHVAMTLAAK
jgi:hypothetical protein